MATLLLSEDALAASGAAAPLPNPIKSTGPSLVAPVKGRSPLASLRLALAACFAISAVCCKATLVAAQAQPAASQQAAHSDIGTLTADHYFTVFMHRDVPEAVRRVALRRLWVLMHLTVSCDELCYEPHLATFSFAHLPGEKLPVTTQ